MRSETLQDFEDRVLHNQRLLLRRGQDLDAYTLAEVAARSSAARAAVAFALTVCALPYLVDAVFRAELTPRAVYYIAWAASFASLLYALRIHKRRRAARQALMDIKRRFPDLRSEFEAG
jgi:hypothetical protein